MKVRELMSTPVTTLAPTDTLEGAEDLMITSRVRHLPVVDGDMLVGLVSLSDLLAASISWLRDPSSDEDRAAKRKYQVSEVMRRSLETVQAGDDAADAADIFLEQKISCLPVVDDRHHLLGILTDSDFVRLARSMLVEPAPAQSMREAPAPAKRRVKKAPVKARRAQKPASRAATSRAASARSRKKPSRSTAKPAPKKRARG
jgi:CBS domain-containing membrane protein